MTEIKTRAPANYASTFVSVKDFGAVGDGVTDDTAAINRSIESLGAQGGTVYFPPGTYLVSTYTTAFDSQNFGIVLRSNITLAGAGVNATIIKGKANAGALNLIGNAAVNQSNITIRDLTVDHNGMNLNAGVGCHAVQFRVARNIWLQRLIVKNSDHHGILTLTYDSQFPGDNTSSVNNTYFVSDVYCENIGVSGRNGGDGLRLFFGADKVTINNVICNKIEHHGIHVGNGVGTVSNIQVFNAGEGALEVQSEGVIVNNVHAEWDDVVSDLFANRPPAGTMGRLFWASDTSAWYRDNGVSWHQVTGGNLSGVEIKVRTTNGTFRPTRRISASNIKLIANVTQNQPFIPSAGDAIGVYGPEVQINNVHIVGPFRYGIQTGDGLSNNLQVSNVTIDGVRSDGIRIDGVNRPRLTNIAILSAGTQAGTNYGINLRATQNARIIGCYINDASLTAGIRESLGTERGTVVLASDFTSASMLGSIGGAMNAIIKCPGFLTYAKGDTSIPLNTTSVVVTHGLSATPSAANISVVARNSVVHGSLYITNITSTTFTINCTSTPANSVLLSWAVRPV